MAALSPRPLNIDAGAAAPGYKWVAIQPLQWSLSPAFPGQKAGSSTPDGRPVYMMLEMVPKSTHSPASPAPAAAGIPNGGNAMRDRLLALQMRMKAGRKDNHREVVPASPAQRFVSPILRSPSPSPAKQFVSPILRSPSPSPAQRFVSPILRSPSPAAPPSRPSSPKLKGSPGKNIRLPPGWSEKVSMSHRPGFVYYEHIDGRHQWTPPWVLERLPDGWQDEIEMDGKIFYMETSTGRVQRNIPKDDTSRYTGISSVLTSDDYIPDRFAHGNPRHIYNGMEFPQLRGDMSFINESIKVFNTDGGKRFSGSFGKAGRINVRGTYYFTKSIINTFPNKRMFDYELQSILNEVNIAFDATSKIPDYVSNIHGSFIDINPEQLSITAYLIFEGPDGMSLTDYIKNYNPNDPRNSDLYKKIYCMIKKTQVAFNSIGYVHRDLKPDNIYVNLRPLKFKLIDFGMAIKKNTIALGGGSPIFMPKHAFDAFSRGLAIPQTESLNSHSINKIWELGPIYDPKKKETIWLGFNQKGAPPDCSAMGGGKRRRKATQYKRNNKNRRTRKQRAAKP